jgi:hypothetical protein
MTTTFPSSAPSTTAKIPTFAVGTVVRVQHNTSLFKIHSHAAWSDDDHRIPTYYNLTGPSGQLHRMVPVERLILRADTMGAAAYADREFLEMDAIVRNRQPRVKHTHCWRCATEISHFTTQVCPKCQGLKCKCGGCRCNWPYASRSRGRGIDVAF